MELLGGGFWVYLGAITLLTLTPGVDTLLVIRNSMRGGWLDGFYTSLGICSGLFVHATLSAAGISLLLMQTAWAFAALKTVGALYLIWLGGHSLYQTVRGDSPAVQVPSALPVRPLLVRRSLREGFLCNVLNPKAILFYMAFLPQWINPAHGALCQSLLLAGGHFIVAMLWLPLLTTVVVQTGRRLQLAGAGRLGNGLTGVFLTGIGVRLFLEK